MARSHGKLLVGIWIDPDFLDLTALEQWAFMMLLSQPKLTMVGSLDYQPARWAQLAVGLTHEDVSNAIVGLEDAGFVCVDHATEELLIRSMTRHDGLRTKNPKLMKGLWGQWTGIASRALRKVAVDNMPDEMFDGTEPEGAARMRRSARMDWAIEKASNGQSPTQPLEQSPRLPPSTTHRPPSAVAQSPLVDFTPPPMERIPEDLAALGIQKARELRDRHLKSIGEPA
jgi:hypothetical protein